MLCLVLCNRTKQLTVNTRGHGKCRDMQAPRTGTCSHFGDPAVTRRTTALNISFTLTVDTITIDEFALPCARAPPYWPTLISTGVQRILVKSQSSSKANAEVEGMAHKDVADTCLLTIPKVLGHEYPFPSSSIGQSSTSIGRLSEFSSCEYFSLSSHFHLFVCTYT